MKRGPAKVDVSNIRPTDRSPGLIYCWRLLMASRKSKQAGWVLPITDQDYEQWVECPFCGCENVHLHQPETGKQGRGSFIKLAFSCECECFWTVKFHFHKGTTFVSTLDVHKRDWPKGKYPVPGMWRD